MKRSLFSGLVRMLSLLLAIGVSVLVVPAAYGQQEVNPAWYDPWPAKKDIPVSCVHGRRNKQGGRKVGTGASKPVTRKTTRAVSVDQRSREPRRHSAE